MINKMVQNKQVQKAANKLEKVADVIPTADVLKFFHTLTDAYRENQGAKIELAKLEAQKELALTEIKNK